MTRYEKAMRLQDADFKQLIGVKKETYSAMIAQLQIAYAEKHKRRGRHTKLTLQDQLFMALKYWRQYVTQKELAFEFEVGEATTHDTIVWVEDTLIKSRKFILPGKKALLENNEIEIVVVDVMESPVERPKKKQRQWYSGKKKRHTIKTQLIVNRQTKDIICIAHAEGKTHDFKLYEESIGYAISNDKKVQGDSGYQGILRLHKNSETPKKKPRKGTLTAEEKSENRRISKERIIIENINAKIKVFKIVANKYRNRRTRFKLRMSLLCGLDSVYTKFDILKSMK
ncbi:MAG: IS5 family transposase [Candidatus Improbicoccus devescovinae]|nr:MAG: IS5 family transposase [Candidatus Improbicoccus devescovinae]